MNNGVLLNTLLGCLSSQTIKFSELKLGQLSQQGDFLEQLLQLIPGQQHNTLMIVLSTIKNYITARYNDPYLPIPQQQKQLFKDNILNLFYQLSNNANAVKLYQEIIYVVIAVDYPWPSIHQILKADLQNQVVASVYFFQQISKVYQYLINKDREPLEHFIIQYFPKIETLVENILTNFNEKTGQILCEILITFYMCFHVTIPSYLRQFDKIDKWIHYLQTIVNAPTDFIPQIRRQAMKIFSKFLAMYTLDQQDGKEFKGWGAAFRNRYGINLYNIILNSLLISQQQARSLTIKCIYDICKNKDLRTLITEEHCKGILYTTILPLMERTAEDIKYFEKDELQFIRREDDLTCHNLRRSAIDLIEMMMSTLQYNNKPELLRFVQYSASVFENQSSTQLQKEVILFVLSKISNIVLKNRYLKNNFEKLTNQYFIPLLKEGRPFIVMRVCQLFSNYLPHCSIRESCVNQLMELIYGQMLSNNLIIRYNAVLAFTALLKQPSALEAAKPHFKNILQIYIKMLDLIDHENLLQSLQAIVGNFSSEIQPVACDLITHLLSVFYGLCKNKDKQDNNDPDEDDNNETTASATLSTIKQILNSQLTSEQYWIISSQMLQLLLNMFQQLDGYFIQVLSLFNVFVYNATTMTDFQFPYLMFRKLLDGNNNILQNSKIQQQLINLIASTQKADQQHWEVIISILKNLIQKMPDVIFHNYPYPSHPQLLLCIIENKKIPVQALQKLDTSQVKDDWGAILQSYSCIVYGVGKVSDPSTLKIMTGVSLFPWLRDAFGLAIIKKLLFMLAEDEQQLYEEQNTMQMLERYAQEEEEEQQADYYVSSGVNYSYNYLSPYDSENDKKYMLQILRNLSNSDANNLMNKLSSSYRKRMEALLTN